MGRLGERRWPALEWLTERWTVPALGLGVAAVFLSIFYSFPAGTLLLDTAITTGETPSAWAVAPTQRAKMALHMAKKRHKMFGWLRAKHKEDEAE